MANVRDNFDKTGIRLVKKGSNVRIGSYYGKVIKVNRGQCKVDWVGGAKASAEWCDRLTVCGMIAAPVIPHSTVLKQCLDCLGAGCINCNHTGKVEG